ncbi:acyltransferase domain-containing protein [Streptomyces pratensis]|uniref:acyltransferase domain-containing protein n=1 Tax=Streptomyces pratensis TaxID=1169025 RepID=UPI003642A3F1
MTKTEKAVGPVLLFPGQGGFDGAALNRAHQMNSQVRAVFESIDTVTVELFSRRVSDVLFDGEPVEPAELLNDATWVSQLAIYGASLAAHRILTDNGVRPSALMGHSLGEITALVAAGAYSVEDGARIVVRRTAVVGEANVVGSSMAALSASPKRAGHLVGLVDHPLLAVAAENHDQQTVLSGPHEAIAQVRALAGQLNLSVAELDTPFAFHNPALAEVAPRFAEFVRTVPRRPLNVPVYSPILQRFYLEEEPLEELLAGHFTRPVGFAMAVTALYERGERVFVETGGRAALTSLVPKILPSGAEVTAVATLATGRDGEPVLPSTLAALRRAGLAASVDGVQAIRMQLAAELSEEEFAEVWAIAHHEVVDLVNRKAVSLRGARRTPAVGTSTTDVAATKAAAPTETPAPDPDDLLATLRTLYAEALEYPEEVFTPDALLEAELGVDSVKQVELLARASQHYGLPARASGFRLADYDTLDRIVRLIGSELGRHRLDNAAA